MRADDSLHHLAKASEQEGYVSHISITSSSPTGGRIPNPFQ